MVLAMILLGVVECVGVGSILPFMQVVSDPGSLQESQMMSYLYELFGGRGERSFLLILGGGVLGLLILNNGYTAYVNWWIFNFSWMRNASISTRMFSHYMGKPYEFFLGANTSDLEKNLFDEVRMVVVGLLSPLLAMAKNIITVTTVFALLLYIDTNLALVTSICMGGAYTLLFTFISRYLKRIGKERAIANQGRFKTADEALKGIKELNVLERKRFFLKRFEQYSEEFSRSQAMKSVVSKLPKHAFEVIAFGGILVIIIYYLALDYELTRLVPVLSLYAFAGYRLMPALQTLFIGLSEIRYTKPALDSLLKDMELEAVSQDPIARGENKEPLNLFRQINTIKAESVSYTYPGQGKPVLRDIDFVIQGKKTVGIIGTTGAGKTTFVDLLLGLLVPQSGNFRVNDLVVSSDLLPSWRKQIGYVPQEIFLLDDTVENNIAYGVEPGEVDRAAVIRASKLARIHETIAGSLEKGYETVVGERGVKLSGGQKQRLGIARALYHNPDVLIFDEGTSALDNATENTLMQGIRSLAGKKTIIMIAHRLTTLQFCDLIIELKDGKIVRSGPYREMIQDEHVQPNCKSQGDQ